MYTNYIILYPRRCCLQIVGLTFSVDLDYYTPPLDIQTKTPHNYNMFFKWEYWLFSQKIITLLLTCMSLIPYTDGLTIWTAHRDNSTLSQKRFMLKDISDCLNHIEESLSMRDNYLIIIRHCLKERFLHCVPMGIIQGDKNLPSFSKDKYCGRIRVDSTLDRRFHNIQFTIIEGYIMHFSMLHFYFEWSAIGCKTHSLVMTFVHEASVYYCGKRSPWSVTTDANQTFMHIIARADQLYEVDIFYSTKKLKWMTEYYKRLTFYHYTLDLKILYLPLSNDVITIADSYEYHVRVHTMRRVVFIPQNNRNIITFYDGPGILSNIMREVRRHVFFASGYIGVIVLQIPKHKIRVTIQTFANLRRSTDATCFDGRRTGRRDLPYPIYASTSPRQGTLCYHKFQAYDNSLTVKIFTFVFEGPTMFDDLYHCYYGGLFIQQMGSGKTINICQNINRHIVYGDVPDMKLLLVWYTGYSYGSISAQLQAENCHTKYLNYKFFSSKYHPIMLRDNTVYCQRVICPSLNYTKGHNCRFAIKGFHKPIGPTTVQVDQFVAVDRCLGNHAIYFKKYNMSVVHAMNWPVSQKEVDNFSFRMADVGLQHFQFLYHLNVSLPYVCDRRNSMLQFGVILKKSTCYVQRVTGLTGFFRQFNSLEITPDCISRMLLLPQNKTTDLLYMVTDSTNSTGVEVGVRQHDCVRHCDYMLDFTVIEKKNSTFYHYVARALDTKSRYAQLFTGYYHQGFRLKVTPPDDGCQQPFIGPSKCRLSIKFTKHKYPIGITKGTIVHHGTEEWHLHPER